MAEREDSITSGTQEGGKRASITNRKRYDAEYIKKHGMPFYSYLGKVGGQRGVTGGLYGKPELAAKIGSMGGKKSKRGHQFIKEQDGFWYYVERNTQKIVKFPIEPPK